MKFKKISIILLILLIFSISAVSAQDASQNDEILANSTQDVGTFTDLDKDIKQSGEFNVATDYKFDGAKDKNYTNGIKIKNQTLVINGNSKTIDANKSAIIFDIEDSNVTINNLIFKNTNDSALFIKNSNVITNNCIFEDNNASGGGAVFVSNAKYSSINDTFKNNYAKEGASLYVDKGSVLNLENGHFISDRELYWGLITINSAQMNITGTTFENINSRYAPAVYIKQGKGKIANSNFRNLNARFTAGAIGVKVIQGKIEIDNCSFINTASRKNGGAIYIDSAADDVFSLGEMLINNSRFENCSSEFGGAIVYLGGRFTADNCDFISNTAEYDGGAIYSSYTRATILNSKFISNQAKHSEFSNGGAYFFDFGRFTANSTRFESNSANEGSSIYARDATLIFNDDYFNNPSGNGSSIYVEFLRKITENGTNYNNDTKSLENKKIETNVEGGQMAFDIVEDKVEHFDSLPSTFDLRKYNVTAPVYNQGSMGACWAFGAVEALQSALLRFTNIKANFSVNNMQNSLLQYAKYGVIEVTEGSEGFIPATYLISWLGISPDEYDEYDELGKVSPLIMTDEDIHITDVVEIPVRKNSTDNDAIKQAILKYGGVEATHHSNTGEYYYNKTSHAQYYYDITGMGLKADPNHSICIVGWDDNYSRENFAMPNSTKPQPKLPEGDGAFIVQNSWGTDWGENGFFYISYYDTTLATVHKPIAFVIRNNETYDMLYQNEVSGLLGIAKYNYYKNVYVAEKDGLIAAVGTFFNQSGSSYEFSVLVNGATVYTGKGVSSFRGYETIKLDTYIQINEGDKFEVIFKNKVPYMGSSRIKDQGKISYMSSDGKTWQDMYDQSAVALLKVCTVEDLGIGKNLVKYYGDNAPFVATVGAGEEVEFELNGVKSKVVADENGTAKLPVSLKPGYYKVTVTHNNTTVIASVAVKNTVIASNAKRASGSNYNMKIKIVDAKGNAVANTNVKITINGKSTTKKTASNGYITLAFKKLTSKQTIKITNPKTGEISTKTITVASRFSQAKNVKMYYNDGTAYMFILMDDSLKKPLEKKQVTVTIDKTTFKIKTRSLGLAAFVIPDTLTPGTHKVTLKYGSSTATHKITVKQVISAKKTTTVKRTSKLVYKVTLKAKKVLKNKKVTLKLNGKKYTAKTNSKGVAKFTVKKSAIGKLKAGKKYTMRITYLKDTLKRTLKVKR